MNLFNLEYSVEEYEFQSTNSNWEQNERVNKPKLPYGNGNGWVLIGWAPDGRGGSQYLWARKLESNTPYRGGKTRL